MQEQCLLLVDIGSILERDVISEVTLSSQGLVAVLADGSRLNWDPGDLREAVCLLVLDGAYEPSETEVLRRLAAHVDFFVDVGANSGYYSVILTRANDALRTIAIEPVSATRIRLEDNLRLNDLGTRVTVVQAAVADQPGMATMFLPKTTGSVGSSLRDLHPDEISETELVTVTTLDDVLASAGLRNGTFLVKVDVEGAERLVLAGSKKLLAADAVFVIELSRKWLAHFGVTANSIVQLFLGLGYNAYAIAGGNTGESLISPIWDIDQSTLSVNFLFIPQAKAHLVEVLLV